MSTQVDLTSSWLTRKSLIFFLCQIACQIILPLSLMVGLILINFNCHELMIIGKQQTDIFTYHKLDDHFVQLISSVLMLKDYLCFWQSPTKSSLQPLDTSVHRLDVQFFQHFFLLLITIKIKMQDLWNSFYLLIMVKTEETGLPPFCFTEHRRQKRE